MAKYMTLITAALLFMHSFSHVYSLKQIASLPFHSELTTDLKIDDSYRSGA